MWDYGKGTDLWSLIYNLEPLRKPSSLSLFFSFCAYNYLWVKRQFPEANPSQEVDEAYRGFPPSWCLSRKLLLAVLPLIRLSDRVSRSTEHALGRQTLSASGCNKELDSSWCGGSAQWATRRRMGSFFLLPEFKSQQHIGSWSWCEPRGKNSQATGREGKGRSLGVKRTAAVWLRDSEGCDYLPPVGVAKVALSKNGASQEASQSQRLRNKEWRRWGRNFPGVEEKRCGPSWDC